MVDCVRDQVSDQLRKAIRIPFAGAVSRHIQDERALGMARLDLVQQMATDLRQVGCAAMDRHAAAQPTPGEIEKLVDHPQCARRARGDARSRLVLDRGQLTASQHDVGGRENRAQRVAQVVGKHSDEELADLLGRLEDVDFGANRAELRGVVVAFTASVVSLAAGIVALSVVGGQEDHRPACAVIRRLLRRRQEAGASLGA